MKFIKLYIVFITSFIFLFFFGYRVNSKDLVNTDYMHEFKYDINNIVDNDINTYFILPDFVNYLEFKLEPNKIISKIELVFDSVYNNYKYKIYSSSDGFRYNEVDYTKSILNDNTESVKLSIKDQFVKIHIFSSDSGDFIHIKEIRFLDNFSKKVNNIEIDKENPEIENVMFEEKAANEVESIHGLISRTLGNEYVNFFDIEILPNNRNKDYFLLSSSSDKILFKGNNVNSLAVALNYYFEHYLKQTFNRFGDSKLRVSLPLPKIDGVVDKNIDLKYRYNYNYVVYAYTTLFWDFKDWEREIDWMALNGFNMALNLVGYEEVVRRFLSEMGFKFSEIVEYLTSPIYLPWQFMGNISKIGGNITPNWFEDRANLTINIQNRMHELGISPIHQLYIGYFPFSENLKSDVLPGGYWSKIKGPGRINFNSDFYEYASKIFYEKQRELLGSSSYFAGDLFHEGGNLYDYDIKDISSRILSVLKSNEGDDSIWIMQSWSHNPPSDVIAHLNKESILILDLHSQLNIRWKGYSKFNGMEWENEEFDNSNWIFGVLNNFGGRSGLYGHANYMVNQFYYAKDNAKFLEGIGQTPEGIGFNDFIDELATELIFEDRLNFEEFVNRYVVNRYGSYNKSLINGFNLLINTVYNATTEVYHEGASESVINARPSMDILSSSKWGDIHKNYDSRLLEEALENYFSVYDEFKNDREYIIDLIDIASEVIVNLANDYYEEIKKEYGNKNFQKLIELKDKFLYLINLQANILSFNEEKSLGSILNDVDNLDYDDYFKDTLKYNKKTLITTWYDKLVSEDDGLRDYANTNYYELIGNLYYSRWERFFNEILSGKEQSGDKYDDYRFDLKWIYDDNSLQFDNSSKTLEELIELVVIDFSAKNKKMSILTDLIYSISYVLE